MRLKVIFSILICIMLSACFVSCGEEETCTVTFETNCSESIEPITVIKGEKASAPKKITKAGYTLDGWYLNDEKWSFVGFAVTENITLEAKWIGNENALHFDGNGATSGSMTDMTIRSGESANLTKNSYTRTGHKFLGWSTAPNGEVEYEDGAKYKMGTRDGYTLYAVWEQTICPDGTHVFSEWEIVEEATCTGLGLQKRTCTVCLLYTEQQRVKNDDNHKYENGTCTLCGDVDSLWIRNEFTKRLGGVSETFEGTISDESYGSAEEAVSAYISNEVAGNSSVTDVNATSMGELNESAIKELILPKDFQEGITSVEEFSVAYSLSEEASSPFSAASAKTVYVIKYGMEYKYYVTRPVNGETITRSYYDSVFNEERYDNCTYTKTSVIVVKEGFQKFSATITQSLKRSDNKIFFEQIISGDSAITAQFGSQTYIAIYVEIDQNGQSTMYASNSQDGSWQKGHFPAEPLVPFYDQHLNYTYFTKTDFGFILKDDNKNQFYNEVVNSQSSNQQLSDDTLDIFAEYYVAEGALSGVRMGYSVTGTTNGFNITSEEEITILCTDYGTTVVNRPF